MKKNNESDEKIKRFIETETKNIPKIHKNLTDDEKCKEISKNYIRIKTQIKPMLAAQRNGVSEQNLAIDSEPNTSTMTLVDAGWGTVVEQIGGKRVFSAGNTTRWAIIGSVQPSPDWSGNNVLTKGVIPTFQNYAINGSFDGQSIWDAYPITTPQNAGSQAYTYNLSASGSLSYSQNGGAQYSGGVSGGISWTTTFNNINGNMRTNIKGYNIQCTSEWLYDYTLSNPSFLNPYLSPSDGAKYSSDVSPAIILENTNQSKNARCRFKETIVWYKAAVSTLLSTTRTKAYGYTNYVCPRS